MRKCFHPFSGVLCLALFSGAQVSLADVFSFSWKDGDSFVETSHREVTIDIPETLIPGGPKISEIEDSKVDWRVSKTPPGYRITRTCESDNRKMIGADLPEEPAKKLYVNHPVILKLNPDGKYLGAETGDLAGEASTLFPKVPPEQIRRMFAPSVLSRTEGEIWEHEVGRFLWREAKRGEHWQDEHHFSPAPGVPPETFVLSVVSNVEQSDGRLLATLLVFESSDADLLDKLNENIPDDLNAPQVEDFLEWNIAPLPLAKRAMRIIVDAHTMRRIEAESYTVQVAELPNGLRTQKEHETLTYQDTTGIGVKFR